MAQFTHMFTHMFIHMFIHTFIHMFIHMCVHRSMHMSMHMSTHMCFCTGDCMGMLVFNTSFVLVTHMTVGLALQVVLTLGSVALGSVGTRRCRQ